MWDTRSTRTNGNSDQRHGPKVEREDDQARREERREARMLVIAVLICLSVGYVLVNAIRSVMRG